MGRGAGRWQAAILEQLEAHALFPLLARLGAARGYPLGAAEASAAHRAARSLERKGLCRTALVRLAAFGLPDADEDEVPRRRSAACQKIADLVGHRDAVNALAFSPDGQFLASAAADGEIRVWTNRPGPDK
jgi:hypothetical protein